MKEERWIAAVPSATAAEFAKRYPDLANPRLGAAVTYATDEFFAPRSRLIDPDVPVFYSDRYDSHGQWMDGWESRRRRGPGHDWCVIRLGRRGRILKLDIDTSFFTGNYPPEAMVEACDEPQLGDSPGDRANWWTLVPRSSLGPDSHHVFDCENPRPATHLRLHIFPDGGIARLRAYGEVVVDWTQFGSAEELDLVGTISGGRAVAWSDAHFGEVANILLPDRGRNMGDGWETARRRGPGNDWAVVALGHPGELTRAVIDTAYFKGNYPDRCVLRGAFCRDEDLPEPLEEASADWKCLLPETRLGPDAEHALALQAAGPVSHVRLDIIPDGGLSRLRLFGHLAK